MKKLNLALMAMLIPFLVGAQNFQKYEEMKEVDAVVITSTMFKLLTKVDLNADDPQVSKLANDFNIPGGDQIEKIETN